MPSLRAGSSPEEATMAAHSESAPTIQPERATERVNILVVDDHAENRLAVRSILASPGYRIVEAASGRDALRRLLEEDFAVLLLDVVMPVMSGFELATLIRQRERTAAVPIVFLTGHAANVDFVYKAYEAGAVDYLVKPLVPEMVRAKVSVFAELFRQRRRIEEQASRLVEAERKDAELRLVELRLASERRFRSLADAVPAIIWVSRGHGIESDGGIEYANQRWFGYTGRSASELDEWRDVVHPDDLERCNEQWATVAQSGDPFEIELRLRAANGSYRWHLVRAVPDARGGAGGEILSWIGTSMDIEGQKRAQEEQKHAYQQAADAVRARDDFLSIASHELRTPLSSLQLLVEMLLMPQRATSAQPTPEWLRPKLESASRQVKRLSRLITELLEVSRITTGRMMLERDEFDLVTLSDEVVAHLAPEASRAGSELVLDAPAPVVGSWDRFRVEQVLTNLLTNAIKFGQGKPIVLSIASEGDAALVRVRDEGIGISEDDTGRIFGRFERAVPVRAYGGMGLGLFIARQVVDAHGGAIDVHSEPGNGSTFTVSLPLGSKSNAAKPGVDS
jgi:PAS domain S-box-containing protein